MNSNLSFAKVRKNILFSKFLANYLNIRVYFMVLFAEKSQKMVLLVKKTDFLIVYRSKGEKESVLMFSRTAGMESSRWRCFLVKLERGCAIKSG